MKCVKDTKEKIKFLEIKDKNLSTPTLKSKPFCPLFSLEIPSTMLYIVPSSSESTDDSTNFPNPVFLCLLLHSHIKHFELNLDLMERRFKLKLFKFCIFLLLSKQLTCSPRQP